MKKIAKPAAKIAAISASATAVMFAINMFPAKAFGFILRITIYGGEIIDHIGFGVYLCGFYPLTSTD